MSGIEMRGFLDAVLTENNQGKETERLDESQQLSETTPKTQVKKVRDGLMRMAERPDFDVDEYENAIMHLVQRHAGPMGFDWLWDTFQEHYGMDPLHYAKDLNQELSIEEEAPEGWEGTVKAMKDEDDIDNPYALANWMKNKGYESHKSESVEEDAEQLDEDMGSMKAIEPELRWAFQISHVKHGGKRQKKFRGNIGRESQIEVTDPKNAMDAWRTMQEGEAAGLVIRVGEHPVMEQVMAIHASRARGASKTYQYVVDREWVKEHGQDDKLWRGMDSFKIAQHGDNVSENKVVDMLRGIMRIAKANDFSMDAMLVHTDTSRIAKQKERERSRKGVVQDPSSEQYKREAKKNLMQRLRRFKAGKAPQFDSPEEFMQSLKSSGILEKLNVGGWVYELHQDNINLRSLRGQDTFNQQPYIEWRIMETRKLWDMEPDDMPPERIRVYFELGDNLQLTPTKVETNRF